MLSGPAFSPLVPQWAFAPLSAFFLLLGLVFASWFLLIEVGSNKFNRKLFQEIGLAMVSSVLLGFGTLFLSLAVGLYV